MNPTRLSWTRSPSWAEPSVRRPADVTDEHQVHPVLAQVADTLGGLDAWSTMPAA